MALPQFTVQYDLLGLTTDSDDAGVDSDEIGLIGPVVFTAQFGDNRAVQAANYSPRPTGFKWLPISGWLDSDGRLKDKAGGTVGLRLPANDPSLGLDKLVYKVVFKVKTPSGESVNVAPGYFEAPSADETVQLAEVLQSTGGIGITKGDTPNVVVGATTTSAPGGSAVVTSTQSGADVTLNFTIPRGETGPAGSTSLNSATAIELGGAGVTDTTLSRLSAGVLAVEGVAVPTLSSVSSLSNKTMSGASNTFSNIPFSALVDAAGHVGYTATGSVGAENGANTWAKIGTFTSATPNYEYCATLCVVGDQFGLASTDNPQAIIAVKLRNTGSTSQGQVNVQAIGPGTTLRPDSFRVTYGSLGDPYELWVKKYAAYGRFAVSQLTKGATGWTVTWLSGAAWQSAAPTGTAGQYDSISEMATLTGTQTLSSKRINPRSTTAATASSLTADVAASDFYAYTALASALTINAPTGTPVAGQRLMFRLKDNGTGRALTWNGIFRAVGVTIPTTTVAAKVTYVSCIYNNSETKWDVIDVKTEA